MFNSFFKPPFARGTTPWIRIWPKTSSLTLLLQIPTGRVKMCCIFTSVTQSCEYNIFPTRSVTRFNNGWQTTIHTDPFRQVVLIIIQIRQKNQFDIHNDKKKIYEVKTNQTEESGLKTTTLSMNHQ